MDVWIWICHRFTSMKREVIKIPHPKSGYKIDGKRVPGVTTIIGRFKDSGGLLWWAFEQGKSAERGEISSLYDRRDEAADAGTLAHNLVESFLHDETMDNILAQIPDNDIGKKALQGYENFIRWKEDNKIRIYEQEMELVSKSYRFGGCPDAVGVNSRGELCLLDWKTSNNIYPDYLIQIAAYKQLWEENNPEQLITGGLHLLRFSKENADFAHHYWSELDDAWEQFKLFRQAYENDKKLKKRT